MVTVTLPWSRRSCASCGAALLLAGQSWYSHNIPTRPLSVLFLSCPFGIWRVELDGLRTFHHSRQRAAAHSFQLGLAAASLDGLHQVSRRHAACYHVVGQNFGERLFVFGLHQSFNRASGQRGKRLIGGGKYGERTRTLQPFSTMFLVGYIGAPPTITVLAFWAEADWMVPAPSRATRASEANESFMKQGKRKVGVVVQAPT
nr:hypothetical protein [Tanacetum cinerariifolium]